MTTSTPHPLATDAALRRRLTALARRWLGHAMDAEDMVQDLYVRTAHGGLPPDDGGARAWLVAVLRNLCIDTVRRRNRFAELLEEAGEQTSPEGQAVPWQAEQAEAVAAALHHLVAHLAPEDVAAVLLHEVFDMGHAELGTLAGRSAVASRQRMHRALRRLRSEPPGEVRTAEEEAVLALCRWSMAHHDPAGLVALLRTAAPMALAAGHRQVDRDHPGGCHAQLRMVNGQMLLAVHLGIQFLCLIPLGPAVLPESPTKAASMATA